MSGASNATVRAIVLEQIATVSEGIQTAFPDAQIAFSIGNDGGGVQEEQERKRERKKERKRAGPCSGHIIQT